jgi:hypothetical protein
MERIMRFDLLRTAIILTALSTGIAPTRVALADDKGNEDVSKRPDDAKPQQAGVFVNGTLAVPGASANGQTVPAKFSQQNAADDKLPTWGHTFKYLTPEQRHAIYQSIARQDRGSGREGLNADTYAVISAVLPDWVALQPLPADISAQIPHVRQYMSAMIGDKAVLVESANNVVVGVFAK